MNEERLKVLKMLKEGRITMEEAELLLDALEGGARDEASPGRPEGRYRQGRSGGESSQGGSRSQEESGSGGRRGPWGFRGMPEGLFNFDWKFDPKVFETGFHEAMKGFEQSMKEFAKDFRGGEFAGGFKEFFGRSTGQSRKALHLPTEGVRRLVLENRWGDMRIEGGGGEEISGSAVVTAWGADEESAAAAADTVEVAREREGDTVVLRCEPPTGTRRARFRVDIELTLPAGLELEVKGMSGDLSASGLTAGLRAASLSGDLIVQGSSGPMALESKSGDIEVLDCEGELRVHALSGDIDIERVRSGLLHAATMSGDLKAELAASGEVALETASGDLRLSLPEDAAASVDAETTGGEIDCDLPLDYAERRAGRIAGTLSGGGAEVRLRSKSGDIALRASKRG